jgi:hypothetical protein
MAITSQNYIRAALDRRHLRQSRVTVDAGQRGVVDGGLGAARVGRGGGDDRVLDSVDVRVEVHLVRALGPGHATLIFPDSMYACSVPRQVLPVLGLELAVSIDTIDTATMGGSSRIPFPILPPQLFRIHTPDSMHACLVHLEVALVLGLELAAIDTATLC